MASMNKVQLIGNLGRDPEVRHTADGSIVATLNIATTRNWKDKDGGKQEETEWHRVVFYGRLGQVAADYLAKSRLVYIEGRIRTRKWVDKEGAERYVTEIVGEQLQMLGSRPRDDAAPADTHDESRASEFAVDGDDEGEVAAPSAKRVRKPRSTATA